MLVIRVPGRGEEGGPLEGSAVSTEEGTVAPCFRPHEETWKLLSLLHMKAGYEFIFLSFFFLPHLSLYLSRCFFPSRVQSIFAIPVIIILSVGGNSNSSTHSLNPYNFILSFY